MQRQSTGVEMCESKRYQRCIRGLNSFPWRQSRKADDSRLSFLDLPLELRDQVYSYALVANEAIGVFQKDQKYFSKRYHYSHSRALATELQPDFSIFGACRQVAAEAKKVFFSQNTFKPRFEREGFLPTAVDSNIMSGDCPNLIRFMDPLYVGTVTQIRYNVHWHLNTQSALQIRYWMGSHADEIEKTFPRLRRAVFFLRGWLPHERLWDLSNQEDMSWKKAFARTCAFYSRQLQGEGGTGIPPWADFEFDPHIFSGGNGRTFYTVDMAHVWKVLKPRLRVQE